ncbi:MAG: GGDEF and EAL domain-containing protein [Proteobacteria bacterium]|nr:GGDEF and EAL domain-containing protein [Pseudomonadota bacterium]
MYLAYMDKNQRVPRSCSAPPPPHPHEEERIARLLGYDILDTEPDVIFDRLTQMAASLTGSPIALVSLVDRNRQWVKSHHGIELAESPREDSFCGYTILNADEMLVIPDSLKDPRFQGNRFVTGEPHIRFYAGVPLHNGDGLPIGSFCVIDRKPRELTPEQTKSLENLARIAMDYLEVHRSNRDLTRLLRREKEVYNRLLKMSADMTAEPPTFEGALRNIADHLDPALGWLSCRITNLLHDGSSVTRTNPLLPSDPELERLWHEIDSHAGNRDQELTKTEFISTGVTNPDYTYLVVPIGMRGKKAALIEMIYPDYRGTDGRIKEVFDIMAVNLGIIAEREMINLDLQYRAEHDELTGALNRNLFLVELTKAISMVDELNPDSVLLFLDLDGFKEVNDNFGHQIGDRLLIEVSERLRGIYRENDLLGRLSGDEFVLLIRTMRPTEDMEALLKRIQRIITQPFMLGDLEIRIGCSIGAAVLDRRNLTTTELIRRSEEAMYMVKSGERKGYCIADEQIIREFSDRLNLDHRIHEAVFERRLLLHFQPIINLATNEICGAEALLRVHEKDGTILSASDFISSLERIRLMPDVDEWVFAEVIRILLPHLGILQSIPDFRISLNVSPAILSTHDYATLSLSRIRSAGIPPSMLRIEVIENHLDTSNASLLQNINLFRSEGVMIAIDDFGTGYSNLQHLTSIPCDTLKIDRMFLKDITSANSTSNELLAAMINLGRNLGYTLIAEGIENQPQADHLLALGCSMGQGYLYAKPMPIGEFIDYATKHSPHLLPLSDHSDCIPTPSLPLITPDPSLP